MTPRPRAAEEPKTALLTVRVLKETHEALQRIQEKEGTPISYQLRYGIKLWLESKGVKLKRTAGAL